MKKKLTIAFEKLILPFWVVSLLLVTACSDDDEPSATMPSIDEVEIGSGNNGIGVIGRDFHLNAEVVAGGTIDKVQININPIENETYTHDWSFEIAWDEFKGLKNSTIHKHFDIPEDAPEGKFDFIITITDENGTKLEETYEVNLIDPANLPVDPYLYLWDFFIKDGPYQYVNESLENPEDVTYAQGDTLKSSAQIKNVKGDGTMYLLFVKKSADHLPRIVDDIDFSKVIVYDVFQHENEEDVDYFSNVIFDGQGGFIRPSPEFTIGASVDNNAPESNPIDGEKAWENGEYYFGVVYTNSTYNISVYHYLGVTIEGF
ncbi:hypothetical protein OKW21_006101 [Catalinimonas alkaloidigena]|uniref:DUF4625 domain-containing protein n=1 Tax=Catalinimonas alkaloidigena TaxID=1075417 RepID=UPI002404E4E3|nr:DUF4625 domain-containing protein [Catalinimonas alkaloidigena]MDF9800838.1 hypothetical protein [Catalinimonas alkaloidigena]